MLSISAKHQVYLAIQAIDFRCGLDKLVSLCSTQFALDPFSGHYFIFRNRKGSAVKIIVYDSQGFWLCQKRLSKGTFRHWPSHSTSMVMLHPTQLQVLLQNGNPQVLALELPWRSLSD